MGAGGGTVTRVRHMTTDLTNLPQRFQGKVALITGAGSGIGRAVAQRLAAEGASVFAHDINGEALEATAELVRDAGGTISTRVGSIAERAECFATVAAAVAEFGKLDVLGNVAGISRAQHFTEIDEESYRRLFAVNVDGPFFLCQAAVPHLLESSGNIVNSASNAGLMGTPYTVDYSMNKGAVVQLTKSLAMEYGKSNMRVNAIAPGGIMSTLTRQFSMPGDVDMDLMAPLIGHRGMGIPEDIAVLFALVASDEAVNIHGAVFSSDRGLTAS